MAGNGSNYRPHEEGGLGTEAGSYLRLIDSCITQLKAQGPSRTCNESNEEEEEGDLGTAGRERLLGAVHRMRAPGPTSPAKRT